jgi:cephalosporin hydroxylase
MIKPYVVDLFHQFYYKSDKSWPSNSFLGYPIQQCPLDLQLYQELVVKLRPHFILQTGVADGGSILFFACLFDLIDADSSAAVIGIDITLSEKAKSLNHPRIRLIEGSSTDSNTLEKVRTILPDSSGMVILDSNHTRKHVADELEIYREFVGIESYLVVEDTNINGHPVDSNFGPGPLEAVDDFLTKDDSFIRDNDLWRRNLFSFHQYGWLKRIR